MIPTTPEEGGQEGFVPPNVAPGRVYLPGGGFVSLPEGTDVNSEAMRYQRESAARIKAQELLRARPANGAPAGTPAARTNGAPAGYPSFLKEAYGSEILSGAALKPRMSYPEFAERQGVTLPRFRSAQARMTQTPLERRLFEAGLQHQGVDLSTYLEQEYLGTTPGGRRRRRVRTISR